MCSAACAVQSAVVALPRKLQPTCWFDLVDMDPGTNDPDMDLAIIALCMLKSNLSGVCMRTNLSGVERLASINAGP